MSNIRATEYQSGYSGLSHSDIAKFVHKTLTTDEQTIVTALIAQMEVTLARKCRRQFKDSLGTDNYYYDILSAGEDTLRVSSAPINSIYKIEVDGVTKYLSSDASYPLVLDTDFYVNDEDIEFVAIPTSSTRNKNAVKVYYTIRKFWGDDVVIALKRWVSEVFLSSEYAGRKISSFSVQGENISFADDLPAFIESLVNYYKMPLL